METNSTEKILEQLLVLMEDKRLYLIRSISPGEIARVLNTSVHRLDDILYERLGMGLCRIISLYRINHASELLRMGISYSYLGKLSGFDSQRSMDREFEVIVG